MSRRRRRSGNRSLRRTGPGNRKGVGRGGRGPIVIASVSPAGDVNTANPTIRAYVEDRRGSLSRHDICVYVDGEEERFDYSRSNASLRCTPRRLSSGTHTVEIEVEVEDAGGRRTARKSWTINVKR